MKYSRHAKNLIHIGIGTVIKELNSIFKYYNTTYKVFGSVIINCYETLKLKHEQKYRNH